MENKFHLEKFPNRLTVVLKKKGKKLLAGTRQTFGLENRRKSSHPS
jgi:hypothetical protein